MAVQGHLFRKAVFLDKDGTLIRDQACSTDTEQIRFLPGTVEGLLKLHKSGYLLFVVTNQPGIARGLFAEEDMDRIANFLKSTLAKQGIVLAGYYFCPHLPEGAVKEYAITCMCRKPQPGLLLQAAKEYPIDLRRSWLIGDILHDIEAGRRAGCRTVLIDNGGETEWILNPDRFPDHVAGNVAEAADIITMEEGAGNRISM